MTHNPNSPPSRLVYWLTHLAWSAVYMLVFALLFVAGYYVRALADVYPELRVNVPGVPTPATNYSVLNEIRPLLSARYIGTLPTDAALEYGAARGLVSALNDPYTVFVEPQVHELQSQSLQGEYGGVGMTLSTNDVGEIIVSPFPDSPAAQAGLQEGDVLLKVDETMLTTTLSMNEVVALVRGPIGTSVSLTVRHSNGQQVTATITRQRIEIPSTTWRLVDSQPTIGHIAVNRFSDKTAQEINRAATELIAQGATHLILDLRNNGGGLLQAGIDTAALFLDGGVVMYETQRDAPEKTYTVPSNSGPLTTIPLVVLVNRNTASAAEIVAGALLDRERAPLIGQTTYGKGSVQLVYDLSDKSSLHVTAYLWFTPTHRVLDKVGLPPTYPIEPATDGGDAELQRALEYFQTTP